MNISLHIKVYATYYIYDKEKDKTFDCTCYCIDDVRAVIDYFKKHDCELVNITYSDSWLERGVNNE